MSRIHKILVACGTGIATSTHVGLKVQEMIEERGFQVHIVQCRVAEVTSMVSGASVVVATAQVPYDLDVPVINGLGFLTGVGLEEVVDKIEARLREVDSYTDTDTEA